VLLFACPNLQKNEEVKQRYLLHNWQKNAPVLVCCLTGYDGIVVDQYFNFDVNIFVIRVTDLKMFIISLA